MKIILHLKNGTDTELNPLIAKLLLSTVNINELINNPDKQKSTVSKFVNIDALRSIEIIL